MHNFCFKRFLIHWEENIQHIQACPSKSVRLKNSFLSYSLWVSISFHSFCYPLVLPFFLSFIHSPLCPHPFIPFSLVVFEINVKVPWDCSPLSLDTNLLKTRKYQWNSRRYEIPCPPWVYPFSLFRWPPDKQPIWNSCRYEISCLPFRHKLGMDHTWAPCLSYICLCSRKLVFAGSPQARPAYSRQVRQKTRSEISRLLKLLNWYKFSRG